MKDHPPDFPHSSLASQRAHFIRFVLATAGKPDRSPGNARSACLTAWQGGEAIELPAYTSDLPSLCQSEKIIEEIVNTAWD